MNPNLIHKAKPWLFNAWPIIAVYLLYKPLYTVLYYGIGNPLAEWISTGSPLLLLVVCAVLFQQRLLSMVQMYLMIVSVLMVGVLNTYQFIMAILQVVNQQPGYTGLWRIVQLLSSQNISQIVVLYLGPIAVAIGVTRLLWPRLKKIEFRKKITSDTESTSHAFGSARFASKQEILKANKQSGIFVGKMSTLENYDNQMHVAEHIKMKKASNTLIYQQPAHAVMIAPSGSGKGVGVIIPTLLDYPGSVLVTDFKGENYYVTHKSREAIGKTVHVFDPFLKIQTDKRCCINVLDLLNPDSMTIIRDSLIVAQMLCPIPQQEFGNTKYFQENAGALIQCFILYIKCSGEIAKEEQTLFKLYQLLCLPDKNINELLDEIEVSDYAYGNAKRLASTILQKEKKELSAVFSSAQTELRFLDDPFIRDATCRSSFFLSDLVKGRADLFLCMDSGYISRNPRMARLITGFVFQLMENASGNVPYHELLFLLDEMPTFDYLPFVDRSLEYGRGFGVRLFCIAITVNRLSQVYPNSFKDILSSDLVIFCGFSEKDTREFISKELGPKTIRIASSNEGTGSQRQGLTFQGSNSSQEGITISETGRPLMTTDELNSLGKKVIIAFIQDMRPVICHRATYFKDKAWKGRFQPNPIEERKAKGVS